MERKPAKLTANNRRYKGTVVVFHAIPTEVEPMVRHFWLQSAQVLQEEGFNLVMLSTTHVDSAGLQVIRCPFEMLHFEDYFGVSEPNKDLSDEKIKEVADWYCSDLVKAENGLAAAMSFFNEFMTQVNPIAVIGWQSTNIVTRVFREIARRYDIPFWCAERGWLKETLMFDISENNFLTETNTSFATQLIQKNYMASQSTLSEIRARIELSAAQGRYKTGKALTEPEFRTKYNIPQAATIFAVFTHGEPNLNSLACANLRETHYTSKEIISAQIHALCEELVKRGIWVVVQEHPFNTKTNREVILPKHHQVLQVNENVASVLTAANFYIFSLTTLQFEAAFQDKSFGLLCKSALFRRGKPHLYADFGSVAEFVDAIQNQTDWLEIRKELQRRIAFLYEFFLFDISDAKITQTAQRFAEHFADLAKLVDEDAEVKMLNFTKKWNEPA